MSPFKKLISVFLVVVMVLTLVPVGTAAQVDGTEPSQFTLNFEAGINYFGFPVRIEKTIADILPGLDVYRRDGDRWVLANDEQPMPFAAYRVDVNAPMTVLLQGETYSDVYLTIPANKTTYFTLPQTDAIGIQELFGVAAKSVRVIGSGGLASSVPLTGEIQPGKVYLVVLNTNVTVTIKAEDKAPVISEVKFNGQAVENGGTVNLTVLEGQTAEGTVTFKASDDKGLRVVKVNGEEVSGVGGEYSKKLTLSIGENVVVIEATDQAGQITTYSFTVVVTENKAPVISEVKFNDKAVENGGTVNLTVLEGETATGLLTFKVTDNDLAVVKVNNATVEAEAGVYSYAFENLSAGNHEVVIEATDQAGQKDTYRFTIEVAENKAPVISEVKFNDKAVANGGTVNLTVLEGQTAEGTVTFKVEDNDLDFVTFNDEEVSGVGGEYSKKLTLSIGENVVVIEATDQAGQITTYSFTVVVVEENKAPVISEVKFNDEAVTNGGTVTLTVLEGQTAEGTVTFKVTDKDLEFVIVNGEVIQSAGGEYSKKLTLSVGENVVEIIAADMAGQMTTYSFTIVVVKENKAPVISEVKFNDEAVERNATVSLEVKEGETATGLLTFKVTDNDLAVVTVNNATVEAEAGVYSYAFENLSAGNHEVVIEATDQEGQKDTYSFTVVVTENAKPVIKDVALLVGSITINATNGGQYTVTVPESSPDSVLTFVATDDIGVKSVTVKVNGSELNRENDGSYVIAFDTATTYSIEITVVDTAEQDTTFAFSVIAILDKAPEISNVMLQIADTTTSIQKGSTYTFTLLEDEITSGTLTFSATDDIRLQEVTLKVNNDSVPYLDLDGQYLWTFDLAEGIFDITIKAVDSFDQENTFAFTIVINKDAAPTIEQADLTVTTSTGVTKVPMTGTIAVVSPSATLNLSISDDVALSKVTVKLNGSDVTTPTIEGTSTVLALPVTLHAGRNTATVTVTDDKGQSTSSTYEFNVTVNELPLIGNISLEVAAKELEPIENGGTYTLGFVGTLPDRGTLTFTATDPEGYLRTLTVWVNGDVVWARSYLGATTATKPTIEVPLANGSNTIRIEAKDGASQIRSVQFKVSIVPDTLPEIKGVTLEYLVQQGVLTSTTLTTGTVTATLSSKTVSVAVDAADQVGKIQTVQLVVDGSTTTLTGTHAPYEGTITLETGTHDIKVIVTDDAEQTASTEFHFVVTSIDELPEISSVVFQLGTNPYEPDKTGTTMHITVRADYLSVATLTFTATDDRGLQTVEVNGSTLAVRADGRYTATVGPLTAGSSTIAIHVVDNAGQPREFVFYVDITIDTEPEITNVDVEYAGFDGKTTSTSVEDGDTLTATLSSTSATISVTATDSVGSVSNVSIFVNGETASTVQTSTLTSPIILNTGTNTIQIVVTDDAQQTVTHTFTFIVNLDKLPEIKNAKLDIAHQGTDNSATSINLVDGGTSTITVASTKLPVSSTLTFDASDDKNMVVVSAEVNGATVYSGTQYAGTLHAQPVFSLNDGANLIKITAKDSIGQTYEFRYTVNIKKNNVPVIEATQLKLGSTPYEGVSNGATVSYYSADAVKATLILRIADENPAGLLVNAKLNDTTIVPNFVGDTYVFTPTLTTATTNTIVVTAGDDYGQTATFTIYVVMKVDDKPVISNAKLQLTSTTITATDGGAYTATAASASVTGTLTFNVTDDRGVESVTLKVNNATTNYTVTGTSYSAVVSLEAGSNNVEISAKDNGGNVATQTFTVTVNVPPIIKDVKVKVNDSATLNLKNGETKNLGLTSLDNTGTITFTIENLEPASVTVKVNGTPKATATLVDDNFTYTATFATASSTTSYAISITATDDQGTTSFSATIVTATDNQDPTVNNVVLRVGTSNIPLTKDTPTTVTLAVPAGATITFTATDDIGIASIRFNENALNVRSDNNYTATLTLNEGDNAIKIIATDLAEKATTFSATVVVVKDNPPTVKSATLTVTSSTGKKDINPITGTINVVSSNATLTFTATDDIRLASAKVIVNNVPVFEGPLTGTETATSVSITLNTGTTNTVTITVTDSAGQETSERYTFSVVIDALPAISATLQTSQGNIPLSNGTSTVVANLPDQGTLVFTISDDGKVKSFKVDVNGVVLTGNPGSKSVTYSLPASISRDGNYVVQITATDDSNQVSSLTATVSRNKAPTISNVKLAFTSTSITQDATLVVTASTLDGTLTFTATDEDGEITATPVVTIKKDGSTVATITSTLVDAKYGVIYKFVPGTYLIEITAIDNLGTATTYKLSLRFDQDTTTPNITNVKLVTDVLTLPIKKDDTVKISQTFLASGATVTFNVSDEHLYEVTVKVGNGDDEKLTSTTGKYEFGLPKTLPAGTTTVTITAKDVVEHEATFSFTLQVQAPAMTVQYSGTAINTATTIGPVKTDDLEQLSITVDSAATVEVKAVKGDSTYSSTTSQVAAGVPWAIDLKDLLTDSGTYTISIKATDEAGNEATFAYGITIVVDNVAPEISDVTLGGEAVVETEPFNVTSAEGLTLSFKASDNVEVTDVVVQIGDREPQTITPAEGVYSYTLPALDIGTYDVTITVKDAAGNENTFSFTLVVTEQESG